MTNVSTEHVPVELVEAQGGYVATVGESPVWRIDEQALYWVDIPFGLIVRLCPSTGERTEWKLPEKVGCIAFAGSSHVLAAMESGIFSVMLETPAVGAVSAVATSRRLAAPQFARPDMRFNDGRCDRQGRFWAGTMYQDMNAASAVGGLYRFTPADGLRGPYVDHLIVQNGLAWSPDGKTMYLSDSHASRRLIWAFDYDIDDGVPHRRRVFADLGDHCGRPDGAAVDENGCYWSCANDAGVLLRFTPGGRLDRKVALPFAKPAMCAFGGKNLDTLFVTSIRLPTTDDVALDGKLVALQVGVRGLPDPEFAGAFEPA
jgi:sugar lactone lactonase YvrE